MAKFSAFTSTSFPGCVSVKQTNNLMTFQWEWNEINLLVTQMQTTEITYRLQSCPLQLPLWEIRWGSPHYGSNMVYHTAAVQFWGTGAGHRVAGYTSLISGPPCACHAGAPHPTQGLVYSGNAFWCGGGAGRRSFALASSHAWPRHQGPSCMVYVAPKQGAGGNMCQQSGVHPSGPPLETRSGWRGDSGRRPGLASYCNDPSIGSSTETLLRLVLPLDSQVWSSSRCSAGATSDPGGADPKASLKHLIGSSDRQCVQRCINRASHAV